LELKPDFADARSNLGNMLKDQRRLDEAVECFRRAAELAPDRADVCSNVLLTLQYRPGTTLADLAAAHAEYDRLHAAPLRTARPYENDRDPQRRLRLGFVSADFGRHPVGYFLVRVLENLGPTQCETVCYSDRTVADDLSERLRTAAAVWRDASGASDERLAAEIRADRIDILFDLAGHTAKNRLPVFARKPAPLAITWAGYVGTTGLTAIDYILADRYQIPPGAEVHYREQVLRMPDGYVCYDPSGDAPPVGPLPALAAGQVSFGCFNNLAKIGPQVVVVWADVLRRVPRSRLVLKYKGIDDPAVAQGLAAEFAGRGIDPQRVVCLGRSPHAELLAAYNQVDLALDPFPYSGGLTTCEALWMGVPIVTCPGETFAGRHSLSHLANVGLTETVARDFDEYVEIAASLAGDLPRLAALRARLRERMAASPLCDGRRFAANLMTLLRDVWRQWTDRGK
jgi:predicted O-linked N-acetylglucosamine transferase (SPINDLY family)